MRLQWHISDGLKLLQNLNKWELNLQILAGGRQDIPLWWPKTILRYCATAGEIRTARLSWLRVTVTAQDCICVKWVFNEVSWKVLRTRLNFIEVGGIIIWPKPRISASNSRGSFFCPAAYSPLLGLDSWCIQWQIRFVLKQGLHGSWFRGFLCTELCRNIPAKFRESPAKCSARHPTNALWRNISANHAWNLAEIFLHYSVLMELSLTGTNFELLLINLHTWVQIRMSSEHPIPFSDYLSLWPTGWRLNKTTADWLQFSSVQGWKGWGK